MSGVYATKIPLENFVRSFTPSNWWYPVEPITEEIKSQLLEDAIQRVSVACTHRHNNYCMIEGWRKCSDVTLRSVKLYLLVHLIPFLIFKRGKDKYSKESLLKLLKGFLRSLGFIGGFAFIGEICLCYMPRKLNHFSPLWCKIASGITSSSVFIESSSRWSEFALTVFPRLLESFKMYFVKQKQWFDIPFGLNFMLAAAFAIIGHLYYSDSACIKRQIIPLFNLIFGEMKSPESEKKQKGV